MKKIFTALFATPLSVLLFNYSANAASFNLRYRNTPIYQQNYFTTDGRKGIVTIDRIKTIQPPSRSSEFWKVLTSSFPDWQFRRSRIPINEFVINEYKTCIPFSGCTIFEESLVGASLSLDYAPNMDYIPDPKDFPDIDRTGKIDPTTGRVRWIQFVRSNHNIKTDIHGQHESVIDLDYEVPDNGTPYYYADTDEKNRKKSEIKPYRYNFVDVSARVDINEPHDWEALLYLVEEIPQPDGKPRKVLIYGGIEWGWHNRILEEEPPTSPTTEEEEQEQEEPLTIPDKVPEVVPQPLCKSFLGCYRNPPPGGGSGGGGFNKYDPNYRYTTIPESTPVIGVITLGAWAIVKTLKLRKKK